MASKIINDFANLHPDYFFPCIEKDCYLNWQKYKKYFKGSNELTLITHWAKITGVKPIIKINKELENKLAYLESL